MTGQLPKIKMVGQGNFQPPEPVPLTRESKIGQYVITTKFAGILKELDSNVALIELLSGEMKTVEI